MSASEGVLLVMGSGHQQFREYLLRAAAEHSRLWLFDPEEPSWQRRYVTGATALDVFDPAAAVRAARDLVGDGVTISGVYCYHEAVIAAAAHVAADLGLPGPTPDAVRTVRDKALTRARLTQAGLAQPRYAVVGPADDVATAAAGIGFPLVAKPRTLGASQGVVKVNGAGEVGWALGVSRSATQLGMVNPEEVLLEEYLNGPEISIDAAVLDGEYLPYLLARKRIGGEPYFEETGHTIDAADPLLADDDLIDMLGAAHRAVGWRTGMTHTEVKLTPTGPVLVEINGRLGGDLIPYVGQLANGIDSGRVAADVALGVRPKLDPGRESATAIRFLCPPVSCVATAVELPPPDPGSGLYESTVLTGPGSTLLMPPDGYIARYGYLIARADTVERCQAVLDEAERQVVFRYDPLPSGQR
ncbi:ATP-grasp domain-containing protein [Micromonospora sp. WMMD1082]|uniref:ATP-grasp domain-containing protein n=1 Tax=Micromonospora sp. WMMD1082 TaxID=3016104 RepID=UPI002416C627|nr:ATP-grasp domain-containing protein [Micromonospora sp. WMMD1082]MDG4792747.1 ATP-grasp domain-containing protein [Micromonospora sp. WMMD1082]